MTPVQTDATNKKDKDGWLVMLYLAGDNNLAEDMVLSLQELIAEGVPTGDRVVAQLDPAGTNLAPSRFDLTPTRDPKGPKSYRSALEMALREFRVGTVEEQNTGSVAALSDFITWAVTYDADQRKKANGNPDATKYLLILSGHGSGVTEDFFLKDETSQDSLSITELQKALRLARQKVKKKIDILGLDACYMAMGEVAYQVRNEASVVIGAEGLEPQFGWPLGRILKTVKAERGKIDRPLGREDLARLIVKTYVKTYADFDETAGRSVDLSATRTSSMNELARAVQTLAGVLRRFDKSSHEKVLLAHWYAQTYKLDQ